MAAASLSSAQPCVLAFDIGIKNLAYAMVDPVTRVVHDVQNINLLPAVEALTCSRCKVKASFTAGGTRYCRRHIPKTHALRPEWTAKGTKKPSNKMLRDWVKEYGVAATGTSNEACLTALSAVMALPLQQPKQANAAKVSLEHLHDAIHQFVAEHWELFSRCSQVLLENQPAFKNPHMKSVQVLLFATLREAWMRHGVPMPAFHLVHAGKKTKGVQAGDAGYAARKETSEKRVQEAVAEGDLQGGAWYTRWSAAPKKSDMADALCMCMDAVETRVTE